MKKNKDELQAIPGIGKTIAEDLRSLGIDKINDLKNNDPKGLYDEFNAKVGYKADPCLLYTFRCAVYFADNYEQNTEGDFVSNTKRDPELLKWWNWKNRKV